MLSLAVAAIFAALDRAEYFQTLDVLSAWSLIFFFFLRVQDFPLLRLDDIVDEQSNIVGFSMFNTTHPFYLEFIRSLNLSWREGCDLTYPGPAVSPEGEGSMVY